MSISLYRVIIYDTDATKLLYSHHKHHDDDDEYHNIDMKFSISSNVGNINDTAHTMAITTQKPFTRKSGLLLSNITDH